MKRRTSIVDMILRCRHLQHGRSATAAALDAVQESLAADLIRREGLLPDKAYEAEDSPLVMAPERESREFKPLDEPVVADGGDATWV